MRRSRSLMLISICLFVAAIHGQVANDDDTRRRLNTTELLLMQKNAHPLTSNNAIDDASAAQVAASSFLPNPEAQKLRPIIYTFFQSIPSSQRMTGMSDKDDEALLSFWKEMWTQAGWNPQVLNITDAQRHENFTQLSSQLDRASLGWVDPFSKISFWKWIAMSAVTTSSHTKDSSTANDGMDGGWYADYDVFPLVSLDKYFDKGDAAQTALTMPTVKDDAQHRLPSDGRLTVYNIFTPSLVSGSSKEWNMITRVLFEGALNETLSNTHGAKYWTDSLGIFTLQDNSTSTNTGAPKRAKRVFTPYGRTDPFYAPGRNDDPLSSQKNDTAICSARPIRNMLAVHFSPEMLQAAPNVAPHRRLPKYRIELAREWLAKWHSACQQVHTSGSEINITSSI